jgi:carbon-monoxide dehydrogenase small subunit
LAEGTNLDPVQESFMDKGAVQCGFCTPGMILTAKGLLERKAQPTREEITRSVSSNLCRCTGYKKIVEAVEAASSAETPKN